MIKRYKLTPAMLLRHVEALAETEDTNQAAIKSGVTYPTFLARFRRAGLKVAEVREAVIKNHVMPEQIVSQVFPKIRTKPKLASFKELKRLVDKLSEEIESQAA